MPDMATLKFDELLSSFIRLHNISIHIGKSVQNIFETVCFTDVQFFTCLGFLDLFHNPYDGLQVYVGLLATVFYSIS